MIDHHQNPKNYAELTFSFPEIGSTCELLYEIIVSLGFDELINNNISTCIYLGMLTDTGSFQYSSVSSRTHFIVSKLLKKTSITMRYITKFTMILQKVDLMF